MTVKINLLILILLSVFYYSCSECGDDVNMGEFKLTNTSKSFVPYTGTETLIFEDEEGALHELKSQVGRVLEPTILIVRTLCEEGFLDNSRALFDIEREQVAYFDTAGKQIFYTDLFTMFEDHENLDSIAIYDHLLVSAVVNGNALSDIKIITEERQNSVSETHREEFVNHSRLIGDTTLYNQAFTEVFVDLNGEGKSIYYNKEKGVLAFKLSETEFWVLKE